MAGNIVVVVAGTAALVAVVAGTAALVAVVAGTAALVAVVAVVAALVASLESLATASGVRAECAMRSTIDGKASATARQGA